MTLCHDFQATACLNHGKSLKEGDLFGEDLSRKRAGHAAQNFSILNRIALNLLKQDKSSKRGIKGKRLKAAWDQPYLLKLLGI